MRLKDFHAFTVESSQGKLNKLLTLVTIISGEYKTQNNALWDTGATCTCISHDVVNQLHLIPTGMMTVQTASCSKDVNTYIVNIVLPNNVTVEGVPVCDSEIGDQGIGMLIGMDIITMGDFSVTNENGKTVFSFRIPSIQKINYVHEAELIQLSHGKGLKKQKRR